MVLEVEVEDDAKGYEVSQGRGWGQIVVVVVVRATVRMGWR